MNPVFKVEHAQQKCRVVIQDQLTRDAVPELQAALKEALGRGAVEFVFDFAGVSLVDSSGIGLLIALTNTLIPLQGKVSVINVPKNILQLFQSMRLITRFNASGQPGTE